MGMGRKGGGERGGEDAREENKDCMSISTAHGVSFTLYHLSYVHEHDTSYSLTQMLL